MLNPEMLKPELKWPKGYFAVIAPCFNEQNHVKIFLESLVHQTFQDFEVVIVDGGSTDNTLKVIMDYAERLKLRVVFHKKRNLGFIRNFGASYSCSPIMLHCNTDNYFEPRFLERLREFYLLPDMISVGGRIYPFTNKISAHIAYQLFDALRWFFTKLPASVRKFRPSGNFTSIRSHAFWKVGGHPEVRCNEDGLLGERIDAYAFQHRKRVYFSLKLYVGHWVKKFESMGGLSAVFFYFYTLGNFFTFLQPLLKSTLLNAERVFGGEAPVKLGWKDVVWGFWNWL